MDVHLTYDDQYEEHYALRSGEHMRLRLVQPSDKGHLQRGFAALSAASRRKRFFASKDHLSDAELHYFTELDQVDHFAIGVMALNAAGEEHEGVAIARFIRLRGDPKCAEVAITVVDAMQGRGIGRLLLDRLVAAAIERGVERLRFECLPHNLRMRRLAQKVCRVVDLVNEDGMAVAEADLPGCCLANVDDSPGALSGLFDFLRSWAAQTVDWQIGMGLELFRKTLDAAFDPGSVWRADPQEKIST